MGGNTYHKARQRVSAGERGVSSLEEHHQTGTTAGAAARLHKGPLSKGERGPW
jgi:hypothetical protein